MFAIIFDSVGAGEWLVLLAVLLVVMGPQRLPATARKIGAYYSKFRRAAESFKRQLMDMDLEMERELQKVEREAQAAVADGQPVAAESQAPSAEPVAEPSGPAAPVDEGGQEGTEHPSDEVSGGH